MDVRVLAHKLSIVIDVLNGLSGTVYSMLQLLTTIAASLSSSSSSSSGGSKTKTSKRQFVPDASTLSLATQVASAINNKRDGKGESTPEQKSVKGSQKKDTTDVKKSKNQSKMRSTVSDDESSDEEYDEVTDQSLAARDKSMEEKVTDLQDDDDEVTERLITSVTASSSSSLPSSSSSSSSSSLPSVSSSLPPVSTPIIPPVSSLSVAPAPIAPISTEVAVPVPVPAPSKSAAGHPVQAPFSVPKEQDASAIVQPVDLNSEMKRVGDRQEAAKTLKSKSRSKATATPAEKNLKKKAAAIRSQETQNRRRGTKAAG